MHGHTLAIERSQIRRRQVGLETDFAQLDKLLIVVALGVLLDDLALAEIDVL